MLRSVIYSEGSYTLSRILPDLFLPLEVLTVYKIDYT
jgi:hypothetical protein